MTSCLKDEKFLDFFFKRLKPNFDSSTASKYPFVSPCGNELNFLAPEDTPIVFNKLMLNKSIPSALQYAGRLAIEFDPRGLAFGRDSGRLYARLPKSMVSLGEYGLLSSSLVNELSSNLHFLGEKTHLRFGDSFFEVGEID